MGVVGGWWDLQGEEGGVECGVMCGAGLLPPLGDSGALAAAPVAGAVLLPAVLERAASVLAALVEPRMGLSSTGGTAALVGSVTTHASRLSKCASSM